MYFIIPPVGKAQHVLLIEVSISLSASLPRFFELLKSLNLFFKGYLIVKLRTSRVSPDIYLPLRMLLTWSIHANSVAGIYTEGMSLKKKIHNEILPSHERHRCLVGKSKCQY